jgi:UDP-N-acetylmuramyl pentapeptide synthase
MPHPIFYDFFIWKFLRDSVHSLYLFHLGAMKAKLLQKYYALLAYFARKYLRKHKPYIIGVNGSVGKTSCRMIIYQTLQQFLPELHVYTSPKNFNGELGLSLSIFQIETRDPTLWTFIRTLIKVC